MDDQFIRSMFDKLFLLEVRIGAGIHYRMLEPIVFNPRDVISIQRLAKEIASHIGLTDLTFIVGFSKQEERVGAHIDLRTSGQNVFIELESGLSDYPDMIPATLAHEICHKWLQRKQITLPIEIENERLTDIAAVYLGFGKLMLNGCEVEKTWYEQGENSTVMKTQRRKSGYLTLEQFAFVYQFVQAMRRIAGHDHLRGLNGYAAQAVCRCEERFSSYYDGRFHDREETRQAIDDIENQIKNVQFLLSDVHKHADYVRHALLEPAYAFFRKSHNTLQECHSSSNSIEVIHDENPSVGFIRAVQNEQRLSQIREQLRSITSEFGIKGKQLRSVGKYMNQKGEEFASISGTMFREVRCPIEGTLLRLPENSGKIMVTCPVCNYRFAYDMSIISFAESRREQSSMLMTESGWFLRAARRILRIRSRV